MGSGEIAPKPAILRGNGRVHAGGGGDGSRGGVVVVVVVGETQRLPPTPPLQMSQSHCRSFLDSGVLVCVILATFHSMGGCIAEMPFKPKAGRQIGGKREEL